MRVMVFVKATTSSEAGEMPSPELLEAMTSFNEELVNAGVMQDGDGLRPSAHGVRIRFDGASRTVRQGPFGPAEELVAGYWIWTVGSMAEAIEWAKRCPNPMLGPSELELRPFYEIEDFGDAATPELRERWEKH
jgi:hypothetical protein